ncbi:CopG family transcriptional regulator [Alteromonas mediterranea]|uniref:ribbon-helix-helix domain-containing protein n=1 Tax=Alteromonas mediterranea TaxID=314275 RepID=UPI000904502B|nr:type II toxin-antitoxin system ParD family antitoxin [Alteromonas mediterranea]APD92684.1 CopG family transcriptional regulator [Alteromonas mediterranea]APD96299.1 CopG family transcriptional regulator [Alteromonas mediterranea]APE00553.1 CopG family transcriptional regulator [Alteromonas mediterranea]QDG37058.1 CopG family transcriptional regulator [Alteromonas mediterranea]
MSRQSITFTEPNDAWLKSQVESKEYSSKSDVINDLIRQARRSKEEKELLRAKLISAEKSGFSQRTPQQIMAEAKERLKNSGEKI